MIVRVIKYLLGINYDCAKNFTLHPVATSLWYLKNDYYSFLKSHVLASTLEALKVKHATLSHYKYTRLPLRYKYTRLARSLTHAIVNNTCVTLVTQILVSASPIILQSAASVRVY